MRILHLAIKDLQQMIRDKRSLVFLVAMPIVFTLFMGFAFRGAAQPTDPRLALGWFSEDPDGALSGLLIDQLAANPDVRLVEIESNGLSKAKDQMKAGEFAAILVIPEGFSASILTDQPHQLALLTDELSTTGQSAFQVVRASVTQLMGSVEISRMYIDLAQTGGVTLSPDAASQLSVDAFQRWQEIGQESASVTLENSYEQTADDLPFGGNPFNQTSPGILVQFAVFGLISSANILVLERKTGTLQRLATTSMPPAQIILGHLTANFLIAFAQMLMLVIFGQWVLKVDYLRQPVAILLVIVALSLCVSSLGLLISVLANDESQVILYAMVAMFTLSALGGAWFPLEMTGETFAAIGHVLPSTWAMDGFQNILIRGMGLSSVLLPLAIMLGYAVLFFVIGALRFRARMNRG